MVELGAAVTVDSASKSISKMMKKKSFATIRVQEEQAKAMHKLNLILCTKKGKWSKSKKKVLVYESFEAQSIYIEGKVESKWNNDEFFHSSASLQLLIN